MKSILYIGVFIFCGLNNIDAQYFNKFYTAGWWATNIIPTNNNEFVASFLYSHNNDNSLHRIKTAKIDSHGTILAEYPLHLIDTMRQEEVNTHSI